MQKEWMCGSWLEYPCRQLSFYPFNHDETVRITDALQLLPGVVNFQEINLLKEQLADASQGNRFVLHAGNCAEGFFQSSPNYINQQLELFKSLVSFIEGEGDMSVLAIARMAGQYAKPRTQQYSKVSTEPLLNYFGDIINSIELDDEARKPNPLNMLIAYGFSKKIYDQVSALNQAYIHNKIFISHEALLLPYEQAMTRQYQGQWYNVSAHIFWLGYRSLYENSPHLEYARGVANPIGLKIGPKISPRQLLEMSQLLNPQNLPGKLIFIYRLGVDCIGDSLQEYLSIFKENNINAVWLCDPMHGNTETILGRKVRYVETLLEEIKVAVRKHADFSVPLSGVHIEATGEAVQECAQNEKEAINLFDEATYTSLMDPRLNIEQSKQLLETFLRSSESSLPLGCKGEKVYA